MLTREFDYELPAERIAQHPAPRGESRLLVLDAEGSSRHRRMRDLPELLGAGDLLVVNDTRVIPARLFARRVPGGGRVELLLVEKAGEREWDALAKPGRKARPGTRLDLGGGLTAVTVARRAGEGEPPEGAIGAGDAAAAGAAGGSPRGPASSARPPGRRW